MVSSKLGVVFSNAHALMLMSISTTEIVHVANTTFEAVNNAFLVGNLRGVVPNSQQLAELTSYLVS